MVQPHFLPKMDWSCWILLTDDLIAEGIVRDVVRIIQQSRKEAGFEVSDRILMSLQAEAHIIQAVQQFKDYLCEQTLCVGISYTIEPYNTHVSTHSVMGSELKLALILVLNMEANAS
jgi:Domain of unknown function (DUF5915)